MNDQQVIELKELRIGNFLEYKGEIVYVSMLSLDIDDEYEDQIGITKFGTSSKEMGGWNRSLVNDLKRIPLAPEWLEKFGFELNGQHPNVWSKDWAKELYVDQIVGLEFQTTGLLQAMVMGNDWVAFGRPLQFLHQLQNLYFALTGEELTIKEKV